MGTPQNDVSISRRPPDIEDYIDMLRRYRFWVIGPAFAGLVLAVIVAFLWPDTFVSRALMRITPQQVPERLVPSAINSQMAERLTQMQQEILSRASLADMIQRLELYKKERQRMSVEDLIDKMRDPATGIKIQMLDVPTDGPKKGLAAAFMIQYRYRDARKAQAVVQALVAKFTEQNATVQRNQANLTATFLSDEARNAKSTLDRLDAEITKYRIQNQGRLPEQFQANVQTLNSLQQQLGASNEALNRNQQEKMLLQTQLQQYKSQLDYYSNASQPGGIESVKNERLINLDKMILDQKAALSAAREIYTDDYPDIKNLKARLSSLEKDRAELEKQESAKPPASPQKIVNPQVAKSVEDTKAAINMLGAQIKAKDSDIEERVRQHEQINRAIASYQSRIEGSPMSEQTYASLQREYQLAKDKYDDLSKRREISTTAQNLEERKAGENLEQIDPPSLPEEPTEPNRLAIVGVGTAAGLVLGVVLAGIKEMKDTSLKNLKDVRAYTNLPVLSSIPLLENALLVRRKRRLAWLAWSSAVVVGSIAMASSMYYYYFGRS